MSAITTPTGELLSGSRSAPGLSHARRTKSASGQPRILGISTTLLSRARSIRTAVASGFAGADASRVDWVDVAKGISVLLMVFGHIVGGLAVRNLVDASSLASQLSNWKYQFNMPGLFVLCGLFLHSACRRPLGVFVSRRASALLYPAILFGALSIAAMNFRATLLPSVHSPVPFSLSWLVNPTVGMWTLSTLFWTSVAFAALTKIGFRGWQIAGLAAAGYMIVSALAGGVEDALWTLLALHMLKYLALLSLGATLAKPLLALVDRARTPVLASACILAFAASAAVFLRVGVDDPLAAVVTGAPGVLGMFSLAALIARVRQVGWASSFLQLLGRYSMQIFVLHSIAHAGTRFVLFRILGINDPWVLFPASMVVGLALPLAVVWVVNTVHMGYVFKFGPHERTLAKRAASAAKESAPVSTGRMAA